MPSVANRELVDDLCLRCGICCDGTLFRDVELQPEDDAGALERAGLSIERLKTKTRFPQPCAALGADCRCHIYRDRPAHCRQFECALLQAVSAGLKTPPAALRLIKRARRLADAARRMLGELGDHENQLSLNLRFRRVRRRLERDGADGESAGKLGDLSLAIHDLNVLLSRAFYPGSRGA